MANAKSLARRIVTKVVLFRQLGLLLATLGLSVVMALLVPVFFTIDNIRDIFLNTCIIGLVSVGMTMVILIAEIDLSVGSQLAVGATVAALYIAAGGSTLMSIVIGIAVGALMGFINGILIYATRAPSIIITLGTMSILRGLNIQIMHGEWIVGLPQRFWLLGNLRVLGVPLPVWITIVVAVVFIILIRNTNFGRDLYAIGGNLNAAKLSGINVNKVKVIVFTLSGALVGLASVIFAARFGWVVSNSGQGFEFSVIGAVVVGGTSIFGGVGGIGSSLFGALLMGILPNSLVLLKVPPTWEKTILGILILYAVISDRLIKNRTDRGLAR